MRLYRAQGEISANGGNSSVEDVVLK